MESLNLKIIEVGTREYEQMIELRMEVLLKPIGIPRSYITPDAEKNDILLGAFEDDNLIGCCVLSPKDEYVVQLRQMAVKSNTQKSGIGRFIISNAEKIAKEKGFAQLMMHARDNVIPFYEKCGYTIVGDGFEEVNIPHHVMIKTL